jgi:hypothetical protein
MACSLSYHLLISFMTLAIFCLWQRSPDQALSLPSAASALASYLVLVLIRRIYQQIVPVA